MSLYFDADANPISSNSRARSTHINDLRSELGTGFDLLPDPTALKTGAMLYSSDTGSANAYAVSISATAYVVGLTIKFKPLNANTGASTINVDGLGVKAIKFHDGSDLLSGDLLTTGIYQLVYNGSYFVIDKTKVEYVFTNSDLPSLTGNAKKVLKVSDSEVSVEWGQGGGKNYTLGIDESIKICDGVTNLDVSILTAGSPFFTSTDNITFTLRDGYSDTITGDLYIGGSRFMGWYEDLNFYISGYGIAILDGNLYAANNTLHKYSGLSNTLLQTSSESGLYSVATDGNDIYAFDNEGNNHYKYTAGDLTAPVALTGNYPTCIQNASFYNGNLYLMDKGYSYNDAITGLNFNSDGTRLLGINKNTKEFFSYTLTTAYDVTTKKDRISESYTTDNTSTTDLYNLLFNADGTKMFTLHTTNDEVYEYALSNAYDPMSRTFTCSYSVSGYETAPASLAFNADGTKMYVNGTTGEDVNQFSLSVGFDLNSTITQDGAYLSTVNFDSMCFNNDGSKFYGFKYGIAYEYPLSTNYDLNTAGAATTWINNLGHTYGAVFNSNGTRLYITSTASYAFFEYSLSTGFDISSTLTEIKSETFHSNAIIYKMSGMTDTVLGRYTIPADYGTSTLSYMSSFIVGSGGVIFSCNTTSMLHTYADITMATEIQQIHINKKPFSSGGSTNITDMDYKADGTIVANIYDLNDNGSYRIYTMDQPSGAIVFGA